MTALGRRRMLPIGVACDGRFVHAVQWARDRRGAVPHRAVSWPYRAEEPLWTAEEIAHLAQVLERRGFVGRRIVLPAPTERASTHLLELPSRGPGVPLRRLATMGAANERQCDPESLTVDFWDVPDPARAGDATQVLAVACDTGALDAMLAQFDAAGFDVAALDWPALALHRICADQFTDGDGAILHLGWDRALLTVIHQREVVYERTIGDFDMRRLHEQVTETMHVTALTADGLIGGDGAEAAEPDPSTESTDNTETRHPQRELASLVLSHAAGAVQELRAALAFVGHRYRDCRIDTLVLTGLGAHLPGLADHLGPELEARAVVLDDGRATDGRGASTMKLGPQRAMAAGLGLWALDTAARKGAA